MFEIKKKPFSRNPASLVSFLVSITLLIVLFYLIDIDDLISLFGRLDFRWVAVYVFLSLAGLLVRAERYRLLLGGSLGTTGLFWVTTVRNLFVDLLPARSGALSYIYVLRKRYDVPLAAGTSTMLLAMIFDYIVFVPMLMGALALSAADIGLPAAALHLFSLVLLIMMIVLVAGLEKYLGWAVFLLRVIAVRIGGRVRRAVTKIGSGIEELIDDLARIKSSRGIYNRLVFLTFFIRGGKYAALYFLLLGFLQGGGGSMSSVIFTHVLLGVAVAEMSSTLPIHSPAGLGTWDMSWTLAFAAMGYDVKIAAASGFAIHILSKVLEYTLGITGILVLFARRRPGREIAGT